METVTDFIFLGSKITVDSDCRHKIKRHLLVERKAMRNLDSVLNKQKTDISLYWQISITQSYVLSTSCVRMWEVDHKEGWSWRIDAIELWCWRRLLRVPWLVKRSSQPWIFIGRTDAGAEAPILWLLHAKSELIGKDPDAEEDWRQGEKGMTENEMIGWHHWLNGHEFEQTLGNNEGQGSLACCSPRGQSLSHVQLFATLGL